VFVGVSRWCRWICFPASLAQKMAGGRKCLRASPAAAAPARKALQRCWETTPQLHSSQQRHQKLQRDQMRRLHKQAQHHSAHMAPSDWQACHKRQQPCVYCPIVCSVCCSVCSALARCPGALRPHHLNSASLKAQARRVEYFITGVNGGSE
jgi:hypothetical protein